MSDAVNTSGQEQPAPVVVDASADERAESKPLPAHMVPLPLWTQLFRFLIAFFISTFILAACLLVTNARMPQEKGSWLPDLMLEWLPKVEWMDAFTNLCIGALNASLGYVALKLFVLHRRDCGKPDLKIPFNIPLVGKYIELFLFGIVDSGRRPFPIRNAFLVAGIRFLTVYMVMMVYRCFVITMTSYPATDNHCQDWVEITNPWLNMILTVVTLGSGAIHCGDLMFSGHTIILCLGFCMDWVYFAFLFKHIAIIRAVLVFVLLFAFFSILASRSHYTDDILVAAYSTITTFMLLKHDGKRGAPWQLQILIRYWPCPGRSENPSFEEQDGDAAHAPREDAAAGGRAMDVVVEAESTLPAREPVGADSAAPEEDSELPRPVEESPTKAKRVGPVSADGSKTAANVTKTARP